MKELTICLYCHTIKSYYYFNSIYFKFISKLFLIGRYCEKSYTNNVLKLNYSLLQLNL